MKSSGAKHEVMPVRLTAVNTLGQVIVLEAADATHLEAVQVVARWGDPDRAQRAAECLTVSSRPGSCDPGAAGTAVLAVGRVSGDTDILDAHTGAVLGRVAAAAGSGVGLGSRQEGSGVRGLSFLWDTAEAPALRLLSCTAGGAVRMHAAQDAGGGPEARDGGDAGPSGDWAALASWAVPKDVLCTSVDAAGRLLAVGAEGSELGLWDVATQQRVFLGKGSKPNRIGLVDPAHNSAVAFLGQDGNKVLVGTGAHKVRMFDVRAHRRPAMEVDFGTSRVMSLAVEPSGLRVWAGDASGNVEVLDLQAARLAGAAKGLTGSARSLACHSELPVLAVVSLDRFLRVYNTQTRKLLGKAYLKQAPVGVAFCPPVPTAAAEPEAEPASCAPAKKRRRTKAVIRQDSG